MIISANTTTLALISTDNGAESMIDEASTLTSGGQIRTQTTGERAIFLEVAIINGPTLRILLDLLKSDADSFFYTPKTTPVEYSDGDFPMSVKITYKGKTQQLAMNGETTYFVDLDIRSVDYV